MNWEIAITLAVTAVVFFGFVREFWPPEVTAFAGVSLLLVMGVLSTQDLQSVFANPAPLTIAAMFVLSASLERTGLIAAMGRLAARLASGSWLRALLVLLLPVMGLSAFINNTPVVVILTPVMLSLAKQSDIAASKLLIPLSFISIFGGTCTLLGTSTNILVDGLAQEAGLEPFGLFEISSVGLMMAVAGAAYLLLFGWWLLPDRQTSPDIAEHRRQRRFLTELLIPDDSGLLGSKLEETPLGKLDDVQVVDLLRGRFSLKRSLATLRLAAGDRLVIDATADAVTELRELDDLSDTPVDAPLLVLEPAESTYLEAIVGPESRLIDKPVAELGLARRFGVYVVAVHRHKRKLRHNFDQLRLQVGDTLLLEGTQDDLIKLAASPQFLNVSTSELGGVRKDKAPLALLALIAVVAGAAILDFPIAGAAVVGATAVIALRCIEPEDAYRSIQWSILLLIYGMLAVGKALESTGAMSFLVQLLASQLAGQSPLVMLGVLYLLTSFLTEVMSNNAAAILLTPIAIGLAASLGVDPRPLVVTVMLAGSASFATPIGYQTNTFVYRAGNYRFMDFVRIGMPLNLLMFSVAVVAVPKIWPFG